MEDASATHIWAEPGMPGYLDYPSAVYTVGYVRADLHDELLRAADELADHVKVVAEWMRANGYDDCADQSVLTSYKQKREKLI